MPKKRHQTKYSKPPSIAPPALHSSSSERTSHQHERSVNELLATMRRSNLNQNRSQSDVLRQSDPSVPPELSRILRLPPAQAPRPRRVQRRDINGRRIPPGPPPPRSWLGLSQSRHAPQGEVHSATRIQCCPLPGLYVPDEGSLVDTLLNRLADNWGLQRDWNRFYLYTLPSRLRTSLIYHVSIYHEGGVNVSDLRLILAGPEESELDDYDLQKADPANLNNDVYHLDLTGSVGRTISLKALKDLLFSNESLGEAEVLDSWDTPELPQSPSGLLPKLTQLSLAITNTGQTASWKQLLSISGKLSKLTHLNLSGWPSPTTTPNATFAKMISPMTGMSADYGGTNPYSHVLDDDWSEAISVLKRLSKMLYSLEYLDLTGCGNWFPALRKESDAHLVVDLVDWTSDWAKITTLRLRSGYVAEPDSDPQGVILVWKREALAVEKHIRTQRAGQGRPITVITD